MRTSLNTLVSESLARGNAVPAFTCHDFTTALAIVAEAESAGRGVILLVAPKTASSPQGLRLVTAPRSLADVASVPVAIQLDHASNISSILAGIEAELGGLAGDEDRAFLAVATGLTSTDQVAAFVHDTCAPLLAIAVGNVHGKYAGEPNLQWDLLEQISAVAGVPLALHGTSDIPPPRI